MDSLDKDYHSGIDISMEMRNNIFAFDLGTATAITIFDGQEFTEVENPRLLEGEDEWRRVMTSLFNMTNQKEHGSVVHNFIEEHLLREKDKSVFDLTEEKTYASLKTFLEFRQPQQTNFKTFATSVKTPELSTPCGRPVLVLACCLKLSLALLHRPSLWQPALPISGRVWLGAAQRAAQAQQPASVPPSLPQRLARAAASHRLGPYRQARAPLRTPAAARRPHRGAALLPF
jgi:hypothetical protein